MSTPVVNKQATLSIPGLEELQARVASVAEEHTDLLLLQRPRAGTNELERAQAFLDYMTDEGVWRTIGTVRLIDGQGSQTVRFEPRGRVQLLQRRAYVRTECIAMCVVMAPDRPPCKCLTLNLSGGGMLLRGLTGVDAGAVVPFDLRLDLLPARIQGTMDVIRFTPENFVGVQFAEISEDDRDKLVRFAYTRERKIP